MKTEERQSFDRRENNDIRELLGRIDERTIELERRLTSIEKSMSHDFITKHEHTPVKILAYGFAGIILISVVTAIVASVIVNIS